MTPPNIMYASLDYKSRLIKLQLIPLMYRLELNDIMFFVSSLKLECKDHFNILYYVNFSVGNTRSGSTNKLKHMFSSTNIQRHSYFYRIVYLWNSIPDKIDISLSVSTIKSFQYSLIISWQILTLISVVHTILSVNVADVCLHTYMHNKFEHQI